LQAVIASIAKSALSAHCPQPHYVREYTLVLLRSQCGSQILLGYKKRGFGQGKWNGFGGKVEVGETPLAAAIRELHEESSLEVRPADIRLAGRMLFQFADETRVFRVHIYTGSRWTGQPVESDEMRPRWFNLADIPFDNMWPDDAYWLPKVLAGQSVIGYFLYAADKVTVLHHCLRDLVEPLRGDEESNEAADDEDEIEAAIVSNIGQPVCVCGANLPTPLPVS
uniref:Oxidized purine nucleoside triphosphate hydrolase n=2 Tax=Macrostomum lignano TaxID=282301 RepID=A0A1I8IIB1_9PLAT